MIYMYIGPSSSGKDTFYKYTLDKYYVKPIILNTTRPKRENEIDGINYYFTSKEKLDQMDKNKELIERRDYNTKYGIWSYATSSNNIDLSTNYITLNTWDGYQKYIDYYGDNVIVPIYFDTSDELRLERALLREKLEKNPKYDELCRRFLADKKDFTDKQIDKYLPYIIDNNGSKLETECEIDNILDKKLVRKKH